MPRSTASPTIASLSVEGLAVLAPSTGHRRVRGGTTEAEDVVGQKARPQLWRLSCLSLYAKERGLRSSDVGAPPLWINVLLRRNR